MIGKRGCVRVCALALLAGAAVAGSPVGFGAEAGQGLRLDSGASTSLEAASVLAQADARDKLFEDDAGGAASPAATQAAWRGFVQGEFARTVGSPAHWSKMIFRADVTRQGRFAEHVKWKLGVRADYDAVHDLYDFYPSEVRRDQRFNFLLRENYLDIGADAWDLRLGRQHVVWGEMVGLFFADVVSAKDLREFVLPEFDILRIPQWAARAEYFKDDFHAELLWIPVPSYDEIGKPDAEFYPAPPPAPPNRATVIRQERIPARTLDNTNYGLRLSYLLNGWDMAAFYYRSMDAAPTFYREITPTAFIYEPRHDRIAQVGGTLAKDFGDVVLKAEAVHTEGRKFEVLRFADSDGLAPSDTLDYIVGLDVTLPAETRFNVQYFERVFFDHDPDMIAEEHERGYSLLLAGKPANGWEAQALWIASFNRNDWLLRPRLTWTFARDWRLAFGADIFDGSPIGLFGRFANRDRVYTELRYSF